MQLRLAKRIEVWILENIVISYSPHVHGGENIKKIMRDVIIALIPALLGSLYFFGFRSLVLIITSAAFCVLFEYLWDKAVKKNNTTKDLSAIVTGILLAFSMPVNVPLYVIIVGDAFAIIVVKCFYGGIGQNFVNPALAARAFLLACWPVAMTSWVKVNDSLGLFGKAFVNVDAVTSATPLSHASEAVSYIDLFFGHVGGCIGETSVLLILLGGIYLIMRKVITPVIPVTYIVSVGLFGLLFTDKSFLFNIMSGGIMLAGFFMATDYVTSPVSAIGQFIYSLAAGIITAIIRAYGSYPEGVTYSILIMNIVTPLIDKHIKPRVFGKAVNKNE